MAPTLLIMAAGVGSRYGGIKQLDGFGPSGEKIIDYTIHDAILSGFGTIVFVIRKDIEADFTALVTDRWKGRIAIEFAYQEMNRVPAGFQAPSERTKPWGTGHAILMGKDIVKAPFSVVNADDFYGRPGLEAVCDYLAGIRDPEKADYCLVGYRLRQTLSEHGSVARGLCEVDAGGYLVRLTETTGIRRDGGVIAHPDASGTMRPLAEDTLVSMNLWGFMPSYFTHLEEDFSRFLTERGRDPKAEFYLTDVVDRCIRSGIEKVRVLSTDARWFGVTYREDRPMVERSIRELVERGEYPRDLWG
jgi:dTDP-glucose pyrophosphorylase